MERKIGEIFEYNGEWYQCVESDSCGECSLFTTECGSGTKSDLADKVFGQCSKVRRTDNKHVIFKKLEKVGEMYEKRVSDGTSSTFQRYRVYNSVILPKEPYIYCNFIDSTVEIEIKQTKEDMEEKKLTYEELKHYYDSTCGLWAIDRNPEQVTLEWIVENAFQLGDTIHEKVCASNLKPFDLEAAKAGKSVCTRDGHKARIISFDRKFYHDGYNYPIVAMVNDNDNELVHPYTQDGLLVGNMEGELDLMMLPEKKEGWVNVAKEPLGDDEVVLGYIFNSYEDAVRSGKANKRYVATVRIEWEE